MTMIDELAIRAIFSIPLHAKGYSIGTVELNRRRAGRLSDGDVAVALEIGRLLTVLLVEL